VVIHVKTVPKHRVQPSADAPVPPSKEPSKVVVRPRRRWPRRILIAANGVVFLLIVAVAAAYGYVRHEIGSVKTLSGPHLTPENETVGGGKVKSTAGDANGLKPENILLIGNQTRQGLTPQQQLQYGTSIGSGTLADIMMILHLDPAQGTASILSVPRDLFSPMPANSDVGSYQKMDAALNNGADGPDNLVNAIQQDLGIPINHFIELNFNGFINSVNALGGINVYFPDPVFDDQSQLYIGTPGCHHLNGVEALALVRARHLQYEPKGTNEPEYDWPYDPESDLARIARTHTFMKIVAQTAKAKGLTDPILAANFISAILAQITVDPGLKGQMLNLVVQYRDLDVSGVPESTLPTSPVNDYYYNGYGIGDVLFPVQPADNNAIKKWDSQALPAPSAPKAVGVVSITGSYQAALDAGHSLATDGLKVTSESAGAVPADTSETLVLYHPGQVALALDVMKYLSGAVMMQVTPSIVPGTIQVDLGSSVNVTTTLPHTATSASTVPSTASSSTAPSTTSPKKSPVVATTVPTPGGYTPSSASDQQQPWDPRAC
jgi:LCP family protein required for cell wall assembly